MIRALFIVLSRLFGWLGKWLAHYRLLAVASIATWFFKNIDLIVWKILSVLGFGLVTYNLVGWGIDEMYQYVTAEFQSMPSSIIMMLKMAKVDEAVAVLFGALSARLTIIGWSRFGGGISRKTYRFWA